MGKNSGNYYLVFEKMIIPNYCFHEIFALDCVDEIFVLDCVDQEDCSVYGHDYACSTEFADWARDHCPAYCGLCSGKIFN